MEHQTDSIIFARIWWRNESILSATLTQSICSWFLFFNFKNFSVRNVYEVFPLQSFCVRLVTIYDLDKKNDSGKYFFRSAELKARTKRSTSCKHFFFNFSKKRFFERFVCYVRQCCISYNEQMQSILFAYLLSVIRTLSYKLSWKSLLCFIICFFSNRKVFLIVINFRLFVVLPWSFTGVSLISDLLPVIFYFTFQLFASHFNWNMIFGLRFFWFWIFGHLSANGFDKWCAIPLSIKVLFVFFVFCFK